MLARVSNASIGSASFGTSLGSIDKRLGSNEKRFGGAEETISGENVCNSNDNSLGPSSKGNWSINLSIISCTPRRILS